MPKFAQDLFKIENTDFWLVPTAEVPVTNLYRDETLDGDELPIEALRLHAVLPQRSGIVWARCARHHPAASVSESRAGEVRTAGPELSTNWRSSRRTRRDILQKLGLPFRTVVLCTGDMGFSSAKTYDIEVWLPGQNGYKEISSCSNFEAFQARRAGIRFRSGKKSDMPTRLTAADWPSGAPGWPSSKTISRRMAAWWCRKCCGHI